MRLRQIAGFLLLTAALPALADWGERRSTPRPGVAPDVVRAGPTRSAVADAINNDPVGDTLNPGPDIVQVETQTDGQSLFLIVRFSGPISAPWSGPQGVRGAFDFDLDQNPGTGRSDSLSTNYCGYPFGVDVTIDFFPESETTTADLLDENEDLIGEVPFTIAGNTLTFEVPLSLIGGPLGPMAVGMIVGNDEDPTDCASVSGDATFVAPPVPALDPTMLSVLALALGAAAIFLLRR